MTDLKKLAEPFPASDVEWRVQSAGEKNGKTWARVLAYITNRAIQQRLDDVCGPESWRNEYRHEANGAVLCGISIYTRVPDREPQWVTKWDGAENTDVEAVKGGLSNAMKRAAVQWGIGRYLYDLEAGYAKVSEDGTHYQAKKDGKYAAFNWDPPTLPSWALPSGPTKAPDAQPPATPAKAAVAIAPEDRKLGGRRMGAMSDDDLREVIRTKANESAYVNHVAAARAILVKRTPDAIVAKAEADVDAERKLLPFA